MPFTCRPEARRLTGWLAVSDPTGSGFSLRTSLRARGLIPTNPGPPPPPSLEGGISSKFWRGKKLQNFPPGPRRNAPTPKPLSRAGGWPNKKPERGPRPWWGRPPDRGLWRGRGRWRGRGPGREGRAWVFLVCQAFSWPGRTHPGSGYPPPPGVGGGGEQNRGKNKKPGKGVGYRVWDVT